MKLEKSLSSNYLDWHYVQAPKKIVKSAVNFLTFLHYFFSIGFLVRTFLPPGKDKRSIRNHQVLTSKNGLKL